MKRQIILTVAYIVIKERKLLLARSEGHDGFYMPGGKPEEKETHIEALIRELNEELSIDLLPETLEHLGVFQAQAYGKPKWIDVQIHGFMGQHKGEPKATSEVLDIQYFSFGEYKATGKTAPAVHLIFKALKKKGLVE